MAVPTCIPVHIRLRSCHSSPLIVRLLGAVLGLLAGVAEAAGPGVWTPIAPDTMGFIPIHAALLPGDGAPFHSRIVMWNEGHDTGDVNSLGAEWGWQSTNAACGDTALLGFSALGTWAPGANLFCSGHAQIAQPGQAGRLLVVGGTADNLYGLNVARTYTPGTGYAPGTWTPQPLSREHRWYATVTSLRDSRAMAAAGHKYDHLWMFGGQRAGAGPSAPSGDSLGRFARVPAGQWDREIKPLELLGASPSKPPPRQHHATAKLGAFEAQAIFGGENAAGQVIDADVWLLTREFAVPEFAAEDRYRWGKVTLAPGNQAPAPRSGHVMLAVNDSELVVFGGLKSNTGGIGTPTNDLWRLYKDPALGGWSWELVTNYTGSPPSARHGHAAVFDAANHRMVVFGGAGAVGAAATDPAVYTFTFALNGAGQPTAASGAWEPLTPVTDPTVSTPLARKFHAMAIEPHPGWSPPVNNVWLYSGDLGPAGVSSDTLWRLVLAEATPRWIRSTPSPTDTSRGARAGHSLFWTGQGMQLFGGTPIGPGGDPDPTAPRDRWLYESKSYPYAWARRQEAPQNLSGHTVSFDPNINHIFSRVPEIYDAEATDTTLTWESRTGAAWFQQYYPVHFLVPGSTGEPGFGGGRILAVNSRPTWYFDVPPRGEESYATWHTLQSASGGAADPGFFAPTGVQYEPGRIMIAGGKSPANEGSQVVGRTSTLDALGARVWAARDTMARRYNHNLVVVPTGQVLAVGGMSRDNFTPEAGVGADPADAQFVPQLWTPPSAASPASWTSVSGSGALAADQVVRNYHSVGFLLPDARIANGGGWGANPQRASLRVYCPPYLFQANGIDLATRPVIASAPASVRYRQAFTVGVASSNGITRACLIRPASTTHGFDQNQRYVPLAINCTGSGTLSLTAPASADSAPPGDYMLFVTGSPGTPDVPSIARWIRVEGSLTAGDDPYAPGDSVGLAVTLVTESSASLQWTAPANDGHLACRGAAMEYDLRYSTAPITSAAEFDAAPRAPVGAPGAPGTVEQGQVTGLALCTTYHFALKTIDPVGNRSSMSTTTALTSCGGGGGGEQEMLRAQRSSGLTGRRASSGSEGAELTPGLEAGSRNGLRQGRVGTLISRPGQLSSSGGTLAAEMVPTEAGARWSVYRLTPEEAGALAGPDSARIVVQRPGGEGGWVTRARIRPPSQDRWFGVRSLARAERLVFLGDCELQQAWRAVRNVSRGSKAVFDLVTARHSRLGDLTTLVDTAGSYDQGLAAGDTLALTYGPAADTTVAAQDWFLLFGPPASQTSVSRRPRGGRGDEGRLPGVFALRQNRPNPFAGTTSIEFDLPVESRVRLDVFDAQGRRVRTLAEGVYPAGRHTVGWDERDAEGRPVGPGVYLYRIDAGSFRAQRKMVVTPHRAD